MELDHIGIAVSNLDTAASAYQSLGLEEKGRENVPSEGVSVSFFPLENRADIELLEPSSEDSVVGRFLKKKGPGIHHICIRVKGLDELVQDLKSKNVQLTSEEPVAWGWELSCDFCASQIHRWSFD